MNKQQINTPGEGSEGVPKICFTEPLVDIGDCLGSDTHLSLGLSSSQIAVRPELDKTMSSQPTGPKNQNPCDM